MFVLLSILISNSVFTIPSVSPLPLPVTAFPKKRMSVNIQKVGNPVESPSVVKRSPVVPFIPSSNPNFIPLTSAAPMPAGIKLPATVLEESSNSFSKRTISSGRYLKSTQPSMYARPQKAPTRQTTAHILFR